MITSSQASQLVPKSKKFIANLAVLSASLSLINPLGAVASNPDCVATESLFNLSGTSYVTATISSVGVCDWTVPEEVTTFRQLLVGGGGGGGGGAAADVGTGGGGGGGGGQVAVSDRTGITPGSVVTVTVGSGGLSGEGGLNLGAAATAGSTGGSSSIVIPGVGSITVLGGYGGGAGTNVGGVGGNHALNVVTGGAASGTQGGSGGTGSTAGSATKSATAGSNVSSYFTTDQVFGFGGGGAGPAGGDFAATNTAAGSGGGGGHGSGLGLINDGGFNGFSGKPGVVVIRYVVTAPGATGTPTGTVSGTTIDISWTAPTVLGALELDGYKIEQSEDAGANWTTVTANTGTTATTASITGLTQGTSYQFRTSAINAVGTSTASTASAAILVPLPEPVVVTPPPVVATPYLGPLIASLSKTSITAGEAHELSITGERLDLVTGLSVDSKEIKVVSRTSSILVVELPPLTEGLKDLVLVSSTGTLTHQGAFRVTAVEPTIESQRVGKVNVGSFNGKLVVYALGLDGAKISWKVAGRWGTAVADGDTLNRFDRPVGASGVNVIVEIYVNGSKQLTKTVLTK
jgi:hypothetical protein